MEVSSGEVPKKFHTAVIKTREKLWKKLERDPLAQKVKTEWMNAVNKTAAKLDARSLARLQMSLTDHAEDIGKAVAIGSNTVNIVLSSVLGAFGVGVGISTQRLSPMEQEFVKRPVADRILEGKKHRWEKRKPAVIASLGMTGAGLATHIFRPVMHEAYIAAKVGAPLGERVAGIVNAIMKKRDIKKELKRVYVGQSHA